MVALSEFLAAITIKAQSTPLPLVPTDNTQLLQVFILFFLQELHWKLSQF
jgi:hypothetical protein